MLVAAAILVATDVSGNPVTPTSEARAGTPGSAPPTSRPPVPAPTVPAPVTVVHSGPGTFQTAAGTGPVAGQAGELHRYHVAVEDGIGIEPAAFATAVDAALDAPDGWTAGGTVRFQRVAPSAPAEFTVYLATPVTSERICAEGWLETDQYTNCRLGSGKVVINSARWLTAVPDYGAPVPVYREYAINHEVGHQLGHGHELCPGPGQPAPVMQQQTLGLHGCVANPWPYLDGRRYQGAPAPE